MSRIGKKPVSLPQGVTAAVSGQTVTAKGPKGELKFVVNDEVLVKMENDQISVEPQYSNIKEECHAGFRRLRAELHDAGGDDRAVHAGARGDPE